MDVVVFDKTGTLTEGHPTVIGWLWRKGRRIIIKMYCLLPSLLRTILWRKLSLRPWKGKSRLSLPILDGFESIAGKGVRVAYQGAEYW